MRSITLFADAKQYKDGETIIFRVKKVDAEGRDKIILEEVGN